MYIAKNSRVVLKKAYVLALELLFPTPKITDSVCEYFDMTLKFQF